jgi:hypothetical protein
MYIVCTCMLRKMLSSKRISLSYLAQKVLFSTSDPQRFQPTTNHYTTIDLKKTKIRTQDHALHHHWHWPAKVSNPRPCTTPPLLPTKTNIRTQNHTYCFPHEIQQNDDVIRKIDRDTSYGREIWWWWKSLMCPNTWHVRIDVNIGRSGRVREKSVLFRQSYYSARAPNLPEFRCPKH